MTYPNSTLWRDLNRKLDRFERRLTELAAKIDRVQTEQTTRKALRGELAAIVITAVTVVNLLIYIGERIWG